MKKPRHRRRPDHRPHAPAKPPVPAPGGAAATAEAPGDTARPGAVARWARRFRRVAAVVALGRGEPPWGALRALEQAKHGGVGIPRAALADANDSVRARFQDKPFLVLEHP